MCLVGVQIEGGLSVVRGSSQSNGHKEISAEGRRGSQGCRGGDFGSEHKGRRGGVTVEGKE